MLQASRRLPQGALSPSRAAITLCLPALLVCVCVCVRRPGACTPAEAECSCVLLTSHKLPNCLVLIASLPMPSPQEELEAYSPHLSQLPALVRRDPPCLF